jgi:stage V sporulation protein B
MGRRSFLKGAAVLALAGVAVHAIGALYRIPLTHIIGVKGVGLYQMAYPVYGLLLTLSTAGIPGAISKMVSERLVRGDRRNARRVFHVSLLLLSAIGIVSAAAMALGSGWIAGFIARGSGPLVRPSMLAAAPALFFVAALTAYRGYFQGLQHMIPTAVSQLWEQAVKIVPGFFIAAHFMHRGPEWGAAGAMWGVALSEAVALAYLMAVYSARRRRELNESAEGVLRAESRRHAPEPFGALACGLARLALPMMAGAIFLPLASLADASIVVNRLTDLGYAREATQAFYGILSGMVNVLVNVPSVLSLSIGTSLIPAIAESSERQDIRAVERKSRMGIRMALLVSLPCAVGLAVLSRPILDLLYGPALTPEQLAVGGDLLAMSAVGVVFLSVVQSTNGALQGMGRVYVPMVSLAVGAAVKITLNYCLIGMPEINIKGAPLGTIACYMIPAAINLAYVKKAVGMRLNAAGMLIKPALASLCMGAVAWSMAAYLPALTGAKPATVIAILVAIPVYAVLAVAFGAVGREELSLLPKGDKIASFFGRMGMLRS